MTRRASGLVVACSLALALGACSSGGGDDRPDVSAVVGGVEIPASETEALVRSYERSTVGQEAEQGDSHEDDSRESVVRFALLYQIKHAYLEQVAGDMGISLAADPADQLIANVAPTEDYQAAELDPEEMVRQARAGRLSKAIAQKLFPDVPVADEAVQAEYDKRADLYAQSWRVKAQVASFNEAEGPAQLTAKARAGAPFAETGRSLGAVNVGTAEITPISPLPPAVLDVVATLAAGQVSDPIQVSTGGWATIRAETREELPRLTFDEVRPKLVEYLADEQRNQLFQDWFAKKLRTAPVRVDEHYGRWDAKVGTVR